MAFSISDKATLKQTKSLVKREKMKEKWQVCGSAGEGEGRIWWLPFTNMRVHMRSV